MGDCGWWTEKDGRWVVKMDGVSDGVIRVIWMVECRWWKMKDGEWNEKGGC